MIYPYCVTYAENDTSEEEAVAGTDLASVPVDRDKSLLSEKQLSINYNLAKDLGTTSDVNRSKYLRHGGFFITPRWRLQDVLNHDFAKSCEF